MTGNITIKLVVERKPGYSVALFFVKAFIFARIISIDSGARFMSEHWCKFKVTR